MTTITASEARARLYRLIDEAAESHQPLLITGKRKKAVLVSEQGWAAIQETLFLLSVPGMLESIHEGMETPVDDCAEDLTNKPQPVKDHRDHRIQFRPPQAAGARPGLTSEHSRPSAWR